MGLFGFFHTSEKDKLVKAMNKRKSTLLRQAKGLFSTGNKLKTLVAFERHILESAEKLDPNERAAIDRVLAEERTEEQIVDYLARIENEIIALIESGDVEAVRTRLKKYIHVMNRLAAKIMNLELSERTQVARIKQEEEEIGRKEKIRNVKAHAEKSKAAHKKKHLF